MDQQIVFIGMDLGTFKSSVASSNGHREEILSAVGWPKDHFAREMLGRDVVFGEDVNEHRLALEIIRPFEKGVLKYHSLEESGATQQKARRHKEAARLLANHAVSLARPVKGTRVYGVIGTPSRASIKNKKDLLESVGGAFDECLFLPEPFCVAYSMNRLTDTLVVDIGAGTIDLCAMYGAVPNEEDQVTVPIGGDVVDEKFHELLCELYPDARLSLNMARQIKEKHGFVHGPVEPVVVTLPTGRGRKQFDVTDPLAQACKTIVPPIIEAILDLTVKYDPEFQQPLLKNILLGGGGGQLKGLDRLLEETLVEFGTVNVTRAYDCVFAGATGALKLAMNMPREHWNKVTEWNERKAAA